MKLTSRRIATSIGTSVFILLCIHLTQSEVALSQNQSKGSVFLCQDDAGKSFYCSDPSKYHKSTEANLPTIARENIDSRIDELRAATFETCAKHGGESCDLGPDQDGSVICADGYTQAALPYESICNVARLQLLSFGITSNSSEQLSIAKLTSIDISDLDSHLILLSIRNLSPAPAREVSVFFDTRRSRSILATGPRQIEPYGSADYYLLPSKLTGDIPIWNEIRYKLTCSNCAELSGGVHLR